MGVVSSKSNFVAWLLEDVNAIYAEKGSPREAQLKEFASEGWLTQADDLSGDSVFTFAPDCGQKLTGG